MKEIKKAKTEIIAKHSKKELITAYSPIKCLKKSNKVSTIEKALQSKAYSIGKLQNMQGQEFSISLMMGWITYLDNVLNLNKPMTEAQIELCAIQIVNDYYYLKMSEITLIFIRIMSGGYGQLYESLDMIKLLSFFKSYSDERFEYAEAQSIQKHKDKTSDEVFNFSLNTKRVITGGKIR